MTNTENTVCCYVAALGLGNFDIVAHDDTCPLLVALDRQIAGDLIPEGEIKPWSEWTYRDDRELITEN